MFTEAKHRKQEAFLGTAACLFVVVVAGYLLRWEAAAALALVFSLPLWVPRLIVVARFHIFERLNGHEGIQLPNDTFDAEATKFLYNHPHANIRSRQNGVGLSDFFWYLLAPADFIHQEHVETASPKYQELADATKSIITKPHKELERLCLKHAAPLLEGRMTCGSWAVVRLRDWWFPVFVRMFYELVFDEECPAEAEQIILRSARDLIDALKFLKTRDMKTRGVLTEYLVARLKQGHGRRHFRAESLLTVEEQALFLQGVVFHTGTIQMAEAMAHVALAIAQHHARFDERIVSSPRYLSWFLSEVLRLYPLFGIAHRITSQDIVEPRTGRTIPRGSVLCFNYPAYHRHGFADPGKFEPHRWRSCSEKTHHYIPFGVANNRPCPGRNISWVWMKVLARRMFQSTVLLSPALHTRSLPDGGLCLVAKKVGGTADGLPRSVAVAKPVLMTGIWLWEQASSVPRSVVQLWSGMYMLWHARQLRLAKSWNERQDALQAAKLAKA